MRKSQSPLAKIISGGRLKPIDRSLQNPQGERERAAALSHKNCLRRPARRERVLIFASGNPISQSKNRFLAVSAPGNPKDFSGNWRGWSEAQNPQDSAVSPLGETVTAQIENLRRGTWRGSLLPPSTSLSKSLFDKLTLPGSLQEAPLTLFQTLRLFARIRRDFSSRRRSKFRLQSGSRQRFSHRVIRARPWRITSPAASSSGIFLKLPCRPS